MNETAILAYLAGFIDADGSITIVIARYKDKETGKIKVQYRAKLSAHNCKVEPIQLLQETFGGGKLRYKKTGKARAKEHWRPCYEWTITSTMATSAMKQMLPFLRIKREQADICLQLQEIRDKHPVVWQRWNPALAAQMQEKLGELKSRCNVLNKRGL
jgi:hypothetical protein